MIGKEGLNLRCHSGNGEEGMDMRDLVEVEFIGLGNLDVDMSRKRQESKITPKLRAWMTGAGGRGGGGGGRERWEPGKKCRYPK